MAISLPMPLAAPVINATLPARRIHSSIWTLLHLRKSRDKCKGLQQISWLRDVTEKPANGRFRRVSGLCQVPVNWASLRPPERPGFGFWEGLPAQFGNFPGNLWVVFMKDLEDWL